MVQELPPSTTAAAQRPLPAAVAEAAVRLAEAAARVVGDEYRHRPGQALEWITRQSSRISDRELSELSTACARWLDHPMFVRQFTATFTLASTDPGETTDVVPMRQPRMSGAVDTADRPVQRRHYVPAQVTRDTAIDAIARTIARSYGCTNPSSAELAAAREVVDQFAEIVKALAVDNRIVHAATPMSAIDNLARLLAPYGPAVAVLRGTTS